MNAVTWWEKDTTSDEIIHMADTNGNVQHNRDVENVGKDEEER